MPILRINTDYPRVIFEPTLHGSYVLPEKSKFTCVSVTCGLNLDVGTVAFHTFVKIAKTETTDEKIAQELALGWLETTLPRELLDRNYWNFFQTTEIFREAPTEHKKISSYGPITVNANLSERISQLALEALSLQAKLEARFKLAKDRLSELATNNYALGFAQTLPEAREYLQFIERVLEAGADIGGYQPDKARSALRSYEELGRRKDMQNRNYQRTLESLRRFSYGVSFPKTWGRRPEASNLI